MKTNPPASSSRPISRKNPRIMPHPSPCPPQVRQGPLTAEIAEIQPVQHLGGHFLPDRGPPRQVENVDAGGRPLYKTAQWRRAQSCRRCSLDGRLPGLLLLGAASSRTHLENT